MVPFAVHSNYGSILYHFRDKARHVKHRNFSYPLAFDAPITAVRVGLFPYLLVLEKREWFSYLTVNETL